MGRRAGDEDWTVLAALDAAPADSDGAASAVSLA